MVNPTSDVVVLCNFMVIKVKAIEYKAAFVKDEEMWNKALIILYKRMSDGKRDKLFCLHYVTSVLSEIRSQLGITNRCIRKKRKLEVRN